jgi:hypothetical protein
MDLSLERRKDNWQFTSFVLSSDWCFQSGLFSRYLSCSPLDKTYPTGGTRRVFKQFVWLEVGSGKMALSRPAHQPLSQPLGGNSRRQSMLLIDEKEVAKREAISGTYIASVASSLEDKR